MQQSNMRLLRKQSYYEGDDDQNFMSQFATSQLAQRDPLTGEVAIDRQTEAMCDESDIEISSSSEEEGQQSLLKKYQRNLIRVTRRQIIINAFEKSKMRRLWSKDLLLKTIEALQNEDEQDNTVKVKNNKINYIVEHAIL